MLPWCGFVCGSRRSIYRFVLSLCEGNERIALYVRELVLQTSISSMHAKYIRNGCAAPVRFEMSGFWTTQVTRRAYNLRNESSKSGAKHTPSPLTLARPPAGFWRLRADA